MPHRRTHPAGTRRKVLAGALALAALQPAEDAHASCWDQAATRYQVSSVLLQAIALAESALDSGAIGYNRDGTRDIGLMQVNSRWLPTLAAHGLAEQDLRDPCTSIHVGAWILAGNVQRLGYTWEAVGAYNARSPRLRQAYAQRIQRLVAQLGQGIKWTRHSRADGNPVSPQTFADTRLRGPDGISNQSLINPKETP